jgi:hypothetical protein
VALPGAGKLAAVDHEVLVADRSALENNIQGSRACRRRSATKRYSNEVNAQFQFLRNGSPT